MESTRRGLAAFGLLAALAAVALLPSSPPAGAQGPAAAPRAHYLPWVARHYQRWTAISALRITALVSWGDDEYVLIVNLGPKDQAMTGWWLHSVVGDEWYRFPDGYLLAVGGSVRVHSGPAAPHNPPGDLRWTGDRIWSDDADEARLYDPEWRLVDSYGYGPLPGGPGQQPGRAGD